MLSLYAYRKVTDEVTTHTLRLPQAASNASNPGGSMAQAGHELAQLLDGRTVCVLFDGHTLPTDQPAAIAASIELLPNPLPDALKAEIREASPHCRLIARRLVEQIAARYTKNDEAYFTRIMIGQLAGTYKMSAAEQQGIKDYQACAEAARAWAKAERTKLGV